MGATNQDRLEFIVKTYAANQQLLGEFFHFHLSVTQKLWSVNRLADTIASLQPPVSWEQVVQDDSSSVRSSVEMSTDIKRFGLEANMHLDCFLMNAMAVLDTLAHEIKVLYSFQAIPLKPSSKPDRVYIGTVKDELIKYHPSKHLTKYLSTELAKPWFDTFASYRHCTTHESLIGSNIHFDVSAVTGALRQAIVPLPDDPRKRPFDYKRNRELKSYCEKTREGIKKMVNHSYYNIVKDIKLGKCALPTP